MDKPDDKAGSRTPRHAARVCRLLAALFAGIGVVCVIASGSSSDGGTLLPIGLSGVVAGIGYWVLAVFLDWAAALYEEIRRP